MLTICEPVGQHLGHQAVLLTICELAGQHFDHQEDLLTICELAGQHLGHPEVLLTFCKSACQQLCHLGDLRTLSVHDGQHLQDAILFCNYCYCRDAAELMNIRISEASEQNGDAFREVNRTRNIKNMFERNARQRL